MIKWFEDVLIVVGTVMLTSDTVSWIGLNAGEMANDGCLYIQWVVLHRLIGHDG